MYESSMKEVFREEIPDQKFTAADQESSSHERLVTAFKDLIRQQQEIYAAIRPPEDRNELPPEVIIRKQLDLYSDTPMGADGTFNTLGVAWDALTYDRYETDSRLASGAGSSLQAYYYATREPFVKLSNPQQVKTFDALAEAAGIPHQRGQTEIVIPERLRNDNHYQISKEEAKLAVSEFSQKVRTLREKNGLSLRQLSQRSGVSFNTIADIERGQTTGFDKILQLSIALNINIADFVDPRKDRKP